MIDPTIDRVTTGVGKRLKTRKANPASLPMRIIRRHLPEGLTLGGPDGVARSRTMAEEAEEEMRKLIQRGDAFTLFHGLRSISPRLWLASGEVSRGPTSRKVAELAVLKYGRWREGTDPRSRNVVISSKDVEVVGDLLCLGEVQTMGAAYVRRIGKGQVVDLPAANIAIAGPTSGNRPQLDTLIDRLDQRNSANEDGLSDIGLVEGGTDDSVADIMVAVWTWPDTDMWDPWAGTFNVAHDVIADVGRRRALHRVLEGTGPMREDLIAVHGCDLPDVIALLDYLTVKVQAADVDVPVQAQCHGYVVIDEPSPSAFPGIAKRAKGRGLEGADLVSEKGISSALKALTNTPEAIRLSDPTYRRPLTAVRGALIYDVLSCHIPQVLTHDMPVRQRRRQQMNESLEQQVHSRLADQGDQPLGPGSSVRVDGELITDLDASVIVDGLLIAVDCFSKSWTSADDRGDHDAVARRLKAVKRKYREWVKKWQRIASSPWLSAIGCSAVVPIVVTAQPEWIDELGAPWWSDDGNPFAVQTAEELVDCIQSRPTALETHAIPHQADA